jgi:hypothetical protein
MSLISRRSTPARVTRTCQVMREIVPVHPQNDEIRYVLANREILKLSRTRCEGGRRRSRGFPGRKPRHSESVNPTVDVILEGSESTHG